MPSATPAIQTDALCKHWGAVRANDEVTLEVAPGEVFGYLGPNGAGKTTTLRLLLDLLRPTSGSAFVLGEDVRAAGARLRRQVGYLPGEMYLWRRMDADATFRLMDRLRGGGGEHLARARQLASRLRLSPTSSVGRMSKGNRQKVGLCLAFMHEPQVLVLDEPTSGLDPLMQAEFHAMVDEARSRGATALVSSHVLAEVEQVADRVGIIRQGRIVTVDSVSGLKERAPRRVRLRLGTGAAAAAVASELDALDGVDAVAAGPGDPPGSLRFLVRGGIDGFVKVIARHEVADLEVHEADLESIFLDHYRDQPGGGA